MSFQFSFGHFLLVLIPWMIWRHSTDLRRLRQRWDWSHRSIILGRGSWTRPVRRPFFGLLAAEYLLVLLLTGQVFPGVAPLIPRPVLLPLLLLMPFLTIRLLLHSAVRAQGFDPASLPRRTWGTLLTWAWIPIGLAFLPLLPLATRALPRFFPGASFMPLVAAAVGVGTFAATRRWMRRSGHELQLELAPLERELAEIFWSPPVQGEVRILRRPPGWREVAAGSPEEVIALRRRWSLVRAGLQEPEIRIPVEFLHGLDATALTAALAWWGLGWDGYNRWKKSAGPGEARRTIRQFAVALAVFDRFLVRPQDPEELLRRYRECHDLELMLSPGGFEEGLAAMGRALLEAPLGQMPEERPAESEPSAPVPHPWSLQ